MPVSESILEGIDKSQDRIGEAYLKVLKLLFRNSTWLNDADVIEDDLLDTDMMTDARFIEFISKLPEEPTSIDTLYLLWAHYDFKPKSNNRGVDQLFYYLRYSDKHEVLPYNERLFTEEERTRGLINAMKLYKRIYFAIHKENNDVSLPRLENDIYECIEFFQEINLPLKLRVFEGLRNQDPNLGGWQRVVYITKEMNEETLKPETYFEIVYTEFIYFLNKSITSKDYVGIIKLLESLNDSYYPESYIKKNFKDYLENTFQITLTPELYSLFLYDLISCVAATLAANGLRGIRIDRDGEKIDFSVLVEKLRHVMNTPREIVEKIAGAYSAKILLDTLDTAEDLEV